MKKGTGFNKFILLWTGELISSIGGGLTSFGLGVYVFQTTGSVMSTTMITLLAFLPTLLLSVPAGVLADRIDRRLLMMVGDGCSALGLLYILVCMQCGEIAIWQIYIGVTVSSVFASLLEPSYRATISDLLTKDEFAKASGLVSLAGSARYLISPFLAGLLLAVFDIRLLLVIDIATFGLTIISTAVVRSGLGTEKMNVQTSFFKDLTDGWKVVTEKKGVLLLVILSSFMTVSMGTIQVLSEPMILDFADSKTLGIAESICACGMLVSSVLLGIKGMKKGYTKVLSISLAFAGMAMVAFGLKENIILICFAGFLFFSMLPISNSCLDYLVRTNIDSKLQGRAWGVIGFLSQIGYVAAYVAGGIGADVIAKGLAVGAGRGCAYMIILSGVILIILAVVLYKIKCIRALEGENI